MELKYCPACEQSKSLTEFGIQSKGKDGHRNTCRICYYRKRREVYLRNPEQHKAYTNEYRRKYRLTPRGRYNGIKSSCYKTGRGCTITSDEFVDWYIAQPKVCYYCEVRLDPAGGRVGKK